MQEWRKYDDMSSTLTPAQTTFVEELEQLLNASHDKNNFRKAVAKLGEEDLPPTPEQMEEFYKILKDMAYNLAKSHTGIIPDENNVAWARYVVLKDNIPEYLKINSREYIIDIELIYAEADKLTEEFSKSFDLKYLIENFDNMSTNEKIFYLEKILDQAREISNLPNIQLMPSEQMKDAGTTEISSTGEYIINLNINPEMLNFFSCSPKNPIFLINTMMHEKHHHIENFYMQDADQFFMNDNVDIWSKLAVESKYWHLNYENFGYAPPEYPPHEWSATTYAYRVTENLMNMIEMGPNGEIYFNKPYFDNLENTGTHVIDVASDLLENNKIDTFASSEIPSKAPQQPTDLHTEISQSPLADSISKFVEGAWDLCHAPTTDLFADIAYKFANCIGEVCSAVDMTAFDMILPGYVGPVSPIGGMVMIGGTVVKNKLWESQLQNGIERCESGTPKCLKKGSM